jgi:NAD+ kinase
MRIGVFGNTTKSSLPAAVASLLTLGQKYGLDFVFHDEIKSVLVEQNRDLKDRYPYLPASELVAASDLIVAFGGDGTILSAARMVGRSQVPILGINLGKLGFLAEASPEDLDSFFQVISTGHHVIEERSLLSIRIENEKMDMHALNEVVIDKSSSSRVIHLSVCVNDEHLVSFQGDGIIIATPTGSTGYALAAGGPIIAPATDVVVIQPISPHSLSARTVIVPETSVLRVDVAHLSEHARVTADGQSEMTFSPPNSIFVRKADYSVKLIKRKDRSYYDVLRAKLLWGSDIRLAKSENKK